MTLPPSPPPPPNQRFLYIVDQHSPAVPSFPLVHTTSVGNLESILASRAIEPTPCSVFSKDLAYTFYGKPAYEINPKYDGASRAIDEAAVCFAIDPRAAAVKIDRIFAFDTGACHGEMYDRYLPKGLKLDDFELVPTTLDTAAKYVTAFFGGNPEYYQGIIRTNLKISSFDKVSSTIIALAAAPISTDFDERVACVEVQLVSRVSLQPKNVLAVVAPTQMQYEPEFVTACKDWGIKPTYYHLIRSTPAARTGAIYQCLGEIYASLGVLK